MGLTQMAPLLRMTHLVQTMTSSFIPDAGKPLLPGVTQLPTIMKHSTLTCYHDNEIVDYMVIAKSMGTELAEIP